MIDDSRLRFRRNAIVTGLYLWVALVVAFAIMLIAAFFVPQSMIEQHRLESIDILRAEGYWPNPLYHSKYVLDNWTDQRNILGQLGPFGQSPIQHAFSIYPRYWNGYALFLRALLIIGNIDFIRQVQSSIVIMLLAIAVYAVAKRTSISLASAFLLALVPSRLDYVGVSLQYAHVYIPMLIMLIWVAWRPRTITQICYGFLVVGAATCYLDLLTFPVLTLLMPLLADMTIRFREESERSIIKTIRDIAIPSFIWVAGYAGTWAIKWLLSTLITGSNVFADAAAQAELRSQGNVNGRAQALLIGALKLNIQQFVSRADALFIGVCLLMYFVWIVIVRLKYPYGNNARKMVEGSVSAGIPFIQQLLLIIGVGFAVPLAWYAALTQHTTVHYWMTYRNLTPALFAVLIVACLVAEHCGVRDESNLNRGMVR